MKLQQEVAICITTRLHSFESACLFLSFKHICDWIYRNCSKSHIGSYEIIDFKDFKTL